MAGRYDCIALQQATFDLLPDYSCSLPTGKTLGKQWKSKYKSGWFMGEYILDPDPKYIGIKWLKIVIRQVGLSVNEIVNPKNWAKMLDAEKKARAKEKDGKD